MKQRLTSPTGSNLADLLFDGQVDTETKTNTSFPSRLSYGQSDYRSKYQVGFRVVKTFDAK